MHGQLRGVFFTYSADRNIEMLLKKKETALAAYDNALHNVLAIMLWPIHSPEGIPMASSNSLVGSTMEFPPVTITVKSASSGLREYKFISMEGKRNNDSTVISECLISHWSYFLQRNHPLGFLKQARPFERGLPSQLYHLVPEENNHLIQQLLHVPHVTYRGEAIHTWHQRFIRV